MLKLTPLTAVISANPVKLRARREVPGLKRWLKSHHVRVTGMDHLTDADVLFSLGGDGTILSVAAKAAQADVPVLGFNMGRLGYITAIPIHKMYKGLESWLRGSLVISERQMLEISAPPFEKPILALNEVVVRLGSITRATSISVQIENQELGSFIGDGVIVATTTGSTAYSLAAQGPIVHHDVEAFILTPICPHSLTHRPIVFPADQTVELSVTDHRVGNEVQLCIDGHKAFILKPGDRVRIRRAVHKLKLLQDPQVRYYGVLKEKLSWGGR